MFSRILTLAALLAAVLLVGLIFLAGCGGGKKKDPPPSIYGTARINSAAERPRASILGLNYDNDLYSASTSKIERSSSGWQVKPWAVNLPDQQGRKVFSPVAFNDRDGNGKWSGSAELLGFPKTSDGDYIFLAHMSDGTWKYIDENANTIASDAKGYKLYIYCPYSRDAAAPEDEIQYIAGKMEQLQ